jgi:hypothetical protein
MVLGSLYGWTNWTTVVVSVVLAFIFGYSFTLVPLIRSGIILRTALALSLASDTLSIAVMEIIDNAIMLLVPGAMDAGIDTVLFWTAMGFSLLLAGAVAFPINRWLIARGRGHALVHSHESHHPHGSSPIGRSSTEWWPFCDISPPLFLFIAPWIEFPQSGLQERMGRQMGSPEKRRTRALATAVAALLLLHYAVSLGNGAETTFTLQNRTPHFVHALVGRESHLYLPPGGSVSVEVNAPANLSVTAVYSPGQSVRGRATRFFDFLLETTTTYSDRTGCSNSPSGGSTCVSDAESGVTQRAASQTWSLTPADFTMQQ